jgi:hypothetical protein
MRRVNTLTVAAIIAAIAAPATQARTTYSHQWIAQAHCIHYYEAGRAAPNQTAAWSIGWHNRHNSQSRGGMQFLFSTWSRVVQRHHLRGYPSDPADASKAQQLYAAWLLWSDDSGSWHEWSTAAGCGLR